MHFPKHRRVVLAGLVATALFAVPAVSVLSAETPKPETAKGPCAPWVDYPADRHLNTPSPYLGCTNEENLKSMIEHSEDLERGRALGPATGAREADGVQRYKQGQVSLPSEEPAAPTLVLQGGNGGGSQ